MATTALIWELIARDNASTAFRKVGASAETAGIQAEAAHKKLSGFLSGLGGTALLAAGAGALKMAGDFQQSTNVLVTAAGETTANLGLIRKGILEISSSTGTSWKDVTAGMYLLEKAGYRGADALKVEKAAAQGAREENASLATVTQAMTSIMASYHLKASDSVKVMNELKTAAGESKTTMENFAGALSTVLPLASANKISFADVAGSMATLTQHGTSADEATQELANTIRNLAAPNAVAVKEMAQLGISSVDVAQKVGDGPGGRGLAGTLNYLSETVLKRMGPAGTLLLSTFNHSKVAAQDAATMFAALPASVQKVAKSYETGSLSLHDWRSALKEMPAPFAALATQWATTENNAKGFQSTLRTGLSTNQTYADAIKKMTGGANGLNTTLQVTGESMAGTNARIAAIAASAQDAGTNVSGWESTQKLFNVQFDEFKQTAEAAGINLGTKLLPALSDVASFMSRHSGVVMDLVGGLLAVGGGIKAIKLAQDGWAASKTLGTLVTKFLAVGTAAGTMATEVEAADAKVVVANEEAAASAGGAGGAAGVAAKTGVGGALLRGAAVVTSGTSIGTVLAPLITSGDQSQMQHFQDSMDQNIKEFPKLKQMGLQTYAALATAMQNGTITVKEYTDALRSGNAQTAYGEEGDRRLANAHYAVWQKAKGLANQQALLNGILAKTPSNVRTNVSVPGAQQSVTAVSTLRTALLKVPVRVGTQISVDSSAAMAALQSFVAEAGAAQAAAQAVGGMTEKTPALPHPHAMGGGVADGWFTVGEQGFEVGYKHGNNVQIFPHGQSKAMMRGAPGYAKGTGAFQFPTDLIPALTSEVRQLIQLTHEQATAASRLKTALSRMTSAQQAYDQTVSNVQGGVTSAFDLTGGGAANLGQYILSLQNNVSAAGSFASGLGNLRKRGLSASLINSLGALGVSAGGNAVNMLQGASAGDLKFINQLAGLDNRYANQAGHAVADAYNGPSLAAAKASVAAWQKVERALDRQAAAVSKKIDRQTGGVHINQVIVNAGMGSSGVNIGRTIITEIEKYVGHKVTL